MASKSNIEWTGHTWNPLAGCSVITPGCKRCYAMRLAKRLGAMGNPLYAGLTQDTNGGAVWTGEMRKAPRHTLLEPLRRKKPTTYFVNSMSDLFHENVPDEWIDEIFAVMALCRGHTFQILTKRAERMRSYFAKPERLNIINGVVWSRLGTPEGSKVAHSGNWRAVLPLPNVWLGVSTEDQTRADERIPELLRTPAAIRFISAEPLLGPINLTKWLHDSDCALLDPSARICTCSEPREVSLNWVIVGGESGNGYRYMDPEWANDIGWQCKKAGVAFFLKQMAGKKPIPLGMLVREMPVVA